MLSKSWRSPKETAPHTEAVVWGNTTAPATREGRTKTNLCYAISRRMPVRAKGGYREVATALRPQWVAGGEGLKAYTLYDANLAHF
jgi:hypothetical protein